ncbi:FAD-dependent monooxygenase [Paraburkholderia aspalathi]|uniref:2-polyprenyl-6-methoxyphenol hydroxylase n=1 Tax=Paraburkholderia aspalathi TaxID=1324617 RepID=A0A1I7BFJ8_9BURK|nr:FAD-dependent monooxygenase [Paraburkholderia aspalathi]SFT85881.1 2-polyprenyl-6-methoxyphenol hydroxylase [Paraburkholderia aspalathi]
MASPHKVLIVGGGISGMTLAHGLARDGADVRVVECSHRTDQQGTGISLLGNALRALDRVGLADSCMAAGSGWDTVSVRNDAGEIVNERRPPRTFRADAPGAIGIMRPKLAEVLEGHALASGARIDYGTSVDDLEQDGDGVSYRLSTGEAGRCDLLVIADGTYSKTRSKVFGTHYRPEYAGQGAWRFTVERPPGFDGLVLYKHGDGRMVGGLPLSDKLCYYFFLENAKLHAHMPQEKLVDMFRQRLDGFSAPDLCAALERCDGTRYISYRPFDILLMPQPWHRGRIVLAGDAAHSVTPQLTSGGGMAIEDAVVLTEELTRCANIDDALVAYGQRRSERVKRVFDISLAICAAEQDPHGDGARAVELLFEGYGVLAQPF